MLEAASLKEGKHLMMLCLDICQGIMLQKTLVWLMEQLVWMKILKMVLLMVPSGMNLKVSIFCFKINVLIIIYFA